MQHLAFLLVGLGAGAVYGALGLALTTVHKASGVLSIAHGAIAMWGVYVFDEASRSGRLVLPVGTVPLGGRAPLAAALVLGVLSSAALALAAYRLVLARLREAPALAKLVASVGLMLSIQATAVIRFSPDPRAVPRILPSSPLTIGSLTVPSDRLYLAAVVAVLGALMYCYFARTRVGLATTAAAEDELGVMYLGYSATHLATLAWVLSGGVAALVAIAAAPSTGLNPVNLTLFIVPALAAALAARLDSIAVVVVAGLVLGAAQSEISFLSTRPYWPDWATVGISDLLPLLAIIVGLAIAGTSLPERGARTAERLPPVRVPRRPWAIPLATAAAGLSALALTTGSVRFGVITSLVVAEIALSFVLVTGLLGQVSLAQLALAGTAGFALARLTTAAGIGFPWAMVLAVAIATLVGVLVGGPALRIRGAQLAIVTLAGAVAVERLVFRNPALVPSSGALIADPEFAGVSLAARHGTDLARFEFGVFVLAIVVVSSWLIARLLASPTGRILVAVRSNERATAALGIHVAAVKIAGFAAASATAAVGGCLLGYSRGQLSADSFGALAGLSILALAYLGGITSPGGAIMAGLIAPLGVMYTLINRHIDLGRWYPLVSGAGLVLTALMNPGGIADELHRTRARLRESWRRRASRAVGPLRDPAAPLDAV